MGDEHRQQTEDVLFEQSEHPADLLLDLELDVGVLEEEELLESREELRVEELLLVLGVVDELAVECSHSRETVFDGGVGLPLLGCSLESS